MDYLSHCDPGDETPEGIEGHRIISAKPADPAWPTEVELWERRTRVWYEGDELEPDLDNEFPLC